MGDSDGEENEYSDDPEEGCETIDDRTWVIIVQCFAPKPEDRPDIARVRELVVDLKIQDERQAAKNTPRAEIINQRVDPPLDLIRMEELLTVIRVRWRPLSYIP